MVKTKIKEALDMALFEVPGISNGWDISLEINLAFGHLKNIKELPKN